MFSRFLATEPRWERTYSRIVLLIDACMMKVNIERSFADGEQMASRLGRGDSSDMSVAIELCLGDNQSRHGNGSVNIYGKGCSVVVAL
jgi:hypothetical protein